MNQPSPAQPSTCSTDAAPVLPLIGWREWVAFPGLGIPGIKAKVDTGAKTSALHTHNYEIYQAPEGGQRVRFSLHPLRTRKSLELECDAAVSGCREVKDSGGRVEWRPFIAATVRLGEAEWTIDLSLTNRESMKFRLLLGRRAVAGRFAVDVSQSYLIGKSLSGVYPRKNTPGM